MKAPIIAHALLIVTTDPVDQDSVIGDVQEEYARRAREMGMRRARRWYWAETLRSLPALSMYSRTRRSVASRFSAIGVTFLLIIGMLAVKDVIDRLITTLDPREIGIPVLLYCSFDWADAFAFGALISAAVPSRPIRAPIESALLLLALFLVPSFFGVSSPLRAEAWVLLAGMPVAMASGAICFQLVRKRAVFGDR